MIVLSNNLSCVLVYSVAAVIP